MKPPGIGEAISKGLEAAKPHFVTLLIGAVITMVLMCVVVGILCLPGYYLMCLKAVRGQKPETGDLFIAFKEGLVDHLVALIVTGLCCIITGPLFHRSTFLILDKKMKFADALKQSMADTKPQLVGWIIFYIVVSIVGGLCACITWPIGFCALAYGYEKAGAGGAAPAPAK